MARVCWLRFEDFEEHKDKDPTQIAELMGKTRPLHIPNPTNRNCQRHIEHKVHYMSRFSRVRWEGNVCYIYDRDNNPIRVYWYEL